MDELNYIQILILSVLQAVTEFLPISSSAHLLLPSKILGWADQGIFFDISVHFASLAAVIIYLREDVLKLSFLNSRLFLMLCLATIPIVVIAPIIASYEPRWTIFTIAISNILFALLLYASTLIGSQAKEIKEMSLNEAFLIGIWQVFSIVSGASRSGTAITGALFLGFSREEAARFAILLSIPTILGALVFSFGKNAILTTNIDILATFTAFLTTFVISYFTIDWFIKFVRKVGFGIFIIYRLCLGVLLLCLM